MTNQHGLLAKGLDNLFKVFDIIVNGCKAAQFAAATSAKENATVSKPRSANQVKKCSFQHHAPV